MKKLRKIKDDLVRAHRTAQREGWRKTDEEVSRVRRSIWHDSGAARWLMWFLGLIGIMVIAQFASASRKEYHSGISWLVTVTGICWAFGTFVFLLWVEHHKAAADRADEEQERRGRKEGQSD